MRFTVLVKEVARHRMFHAICMGECGLYAMCFIRWLWMILRARWQPIRCREEHARHLILLWIIHKISVL